MTKSCSKARFVVLSPEPECWLPPVFRMGQVGLPTHRQAKLLKIKLLYPKGSNYENALQSGCSPVMPNQLCSVQLAKPEAFKANCFRKEANHELWKKNLVSKHIIIIARLPLLFLQQPDTSKNLAQKGSETVANAR